MDVDEFIYPLNRHLTPYWESKDKDTIKLYHGNCLDVLKKMSGNSVQCCVTSPPYWGLRDYGTGEWEGGDEDCDHIKPIGGGKSKGSNLVGTSNREGYSSDGQYGNICGKCGAIRIDEQIGSEKTVDEYVTNIVNVFREVKRVLTNDGTLWLNLGDTYSGPKGDSHGKKRTKGLEFGRASGGSVTKNSDLIDGNLIGVPWRVAFALQQDGWILRQDIIWSKLNPMPESVTNRCTKAHEYIFLLTKSMDYYYDNVKEMGSSIRTITDTTKLAKHKSEDGRKSGRVIGKESHKSGTRTGTNLSNAYSGVDWAEVGRNRRSVWTVSTIPYSEAHFATFPQKLIEPCILAGSRENDIILDPFMGAGTTAITAINHKRRAWGIELNEEYIALQIKRIEEYTVRNTNVWQYMNRHFLKQGR